MSDTANAAESAAASGRPDAALPGRGLRCPPSVADTLRRTATELRLRRAERWAWRGFFWGALAAVAAAAAKGALGANAGYWAIALICLGILFGAAVGAARRVDELALARAADRAFGLHDRLATTLQWLRSGDRGDIVSALIADTSARLASIGARRIWPRSLPAEGRALPVPLFICAALLLSPALPNPQSWLKETLGLELPHGQDASAAAARNERSKSFDADARRRESLAEREAAQRARDEQQAAAGDSAAFKDKSLSARERDFSEFMKKGDDRLKLLEHTDRLPDLQADFASSKYRTLLRQSQELRSGNDTGRLSTQKLGQILREIEKMGRKAGDAADQARDGLASLEEGFEDQAMDAMQGALDKLKDMEDRQRGSRDLSGGRDLARTDEYGTGENENSPLDSRDRRDGYSLAQSNPASNGASSPRLRSTPYDTGIQGARRAGTPGLDTQKTGRPGSSAQMLQYMGEMLQYQRMMEDAIAREEVPREYQDQIRNYFKSIHE